MTKNTHTKEEILDLLEEHLTMGEFLSRTDLIREMKTRMKKAADFIRQMDDK